ncbi:MAG: MarR family transcriptional regulator [Pseudomonadota bacterium]
MQDTDLALLVDRLMRSIHFGLQERAPGFDREGVGPGGGIVLMTLADTGKISLNDLTKRVARDKSQMTRMIRSLEGKGLIERAVSPKDARVTLVMLTPKGTDPTQSCRAWWWRENNSILRIRASTLLETKLMLRN